ncbi:hypothetical protein SCB49_14570 [unidentified eubacterium SCB49]|nr:hypothetical protein SCB49_14570 [unidentified eubacterium SCB49]
MLEILALSFFIKKIKKIAEEKGIKPGKWIAATVISWFGLEILIFVIALTVFGLDSDEILFVMFPAIIIAALSAFLILELLKKQEPVTDVVEK